ncbi:DUF3048 C-terminal domain-containing protein [Clostridium sp. KNHs214]|uniref:DUF3048 C-terminal domain-containing protein n=1 Tax=Clostridium sp. KNHs214 TaxID=1540257 RepID=UPI0005587991|nr:DUF3048 C-terminal domain-containing protein [Clostridium sp. KNHs214]
MKKCNFVNNIILILFSVCCILVMLICYKLIPFNKFPNIDISPYSGEILKNKNNREFKNATEVIYKLSQMNDNTDGLSKADIILQYVDSQNKLIYKGIYLDEVPKKISSSSGQKKPIDTSYLPKFDFLDSEDIKLRKGKKANNIFIDFNEYFSSNFLYKEGQYYHHNPSKEHIDAYYNTPVHVSNIIIQIVNSKSNKKFPIGSGNGLLFSGGKAIDIEWNKNLDSPIKIQDKNGKNISLIRGSTWWIILDESSSVVYN